MIHKRLFLQMVGIILIMLLLAACTATQSAPTSVPPTLTPLPSTNTPIPPTATLLPPTATETPTATATVAVVEWLGPNPAPRGYVAMAYDEESDQVILFGGQIGNILEVSLSSPISGETWAYNITANKWTLLKPPSGPTARGTSAMAYDVESDRVILFGGSNGESSGLNDTWAYDYNTNTWTEMATGPADLNGPRLVYDVESDRIILFGGYWNTVLHNDTWAYDFNSDTWTEMIPSTRPPGINYQAMTYDARADRVLLAAMFMTIDESVWAYDFNTNTWQQIPPGEGAHPHGRDYPVMVYDVESDRTILFGGTTGSALRGGDTWAYDYNTNTWMEMEPSPFPGKLSRHAMTYSTAADRVILFGGQVGTIAFDYTDLTWSYDYNTNTWTNMEPHP